MSLAIASSRESSPAPIPRIIEERNQMEKTLSSLVENHWLICLTTDEIMDLQELFQPTIKELSRQDTTISKAYIAYKVSLNYLGPRHLETRASYKTMLHTIQQRQHDQSPLLKALIELNKIDHKSEPYTSCEMHTALKQYRSAMQNLKEKQQSIADQEEIS